MLFSIVCVVCYLLLVKHYLFQLFDVCMTYYICLIYLYHFEISVKGKKRKSQPGTEVTIIP